MKKIILIATVAVSLSGLSAFAQGNFIFGTGASYVWNAATGTRGGAFNVGFLYGTGTPAVANSTGLASTRTNAVDAAAGGGWAAILADPNYTLAQNFTTGTTVVGTLSATGGVVYNLGGNFLVTGTSANGGTVNVYMFAWDNTYATPQDAAAHSAGLGWSKPFAYTYAANPGAAGGNFSAAAVTAGVGAQFGVSPVPEPATFALAGLGAAALMIFRRCNK